MAKEIIVDGVTYVIKEFKIDSTNKEPYCIVRTRSAGVFAGRIAEKDGMEYTLTNARRLWYWAGAATLSQLSVEGTSKPKDCKFPCEVEVVGLTEVIEVLICTPKAEKSIKEVKIWEQ